MAEPTPGPDLVVLDVPERSRFEARIGEELAGFAEYERSEGRIVFTHTEVDPRFEGRGVASGLVGSALADVRAAGDLRVVPRCPFVRRYIERHPEEQDLLERR